MDSTFVVGIDVGGQTSKLGVVDARGAVLAQTVIRTDTYSEVEPYIAELAEAVKKVIRYIRISSRFSVYIITVGVFLCDLMRYNTTCW